MKNIKEYIGYFLAFVALVGWGMSIGIFKNRFETVEKNQREIQKAILDNQRTMDKMIILYELSQKEEE